MARKITHKSARNKGKKLERDTAKALKNIGIDAKRVPLSGALSWLKGDVVEFNTLKPHLHECKNCEDLSLGSWWKQTVVQAVNGEVPVLHFTCNYQPVYTVLDTEAFDDLVHSYEMFRPELSLDLIQVPPRKHFLKWKAKRRGSKFDVYLIQLDGQELVIILFDVYLMLRRQDIKRRAQEVIMEPQPA